MALTYEESAALMNDLPFRGRIKVACLKFADSIVGEPTSEPAHNTRLKWAQNTMNAPDQAAAVAQPPTVMDSAVQEQGAAIDDTGLQGSVEVTVKKML
jgi:hypothetical protein